MKREDILEWTVVEKEDGFEGRGMFGVIPPIRVLGWWFSTIKYTYKFSCFSKNSINFASLGFKSSVWRVIKWKMERRMNERGNKCFHEMIRWQGGSLESLIAQMSCTRYFYLSLYSISICLKLIQYDWPLRGRRKEEHSCFLPQTTFFPNLSRYWIQCVWRGRNWTSDSRTKQ